MFQLMPLFAMPGEKAVPVRGPRFSVGRGDDCSLRLSSPYVSWNHCQLEEKSGGLLVHDMASRNGTFVNFDRIAHDAVLRDGDILGVATTCYRVIAVRAQNDLWENVRDRLQTLFVRLLARDYTH